MLPVGFQSDYICIASNIHTRYPHRPNRLFGHSLKKSRKASRLAQHGPLNPLIHTTDASLQKLATEVTYLNALGHTRSSNAHRVPLVIEDAQKRTYCCTDPGGRAGRTTTVCLATLGQEHGRKRARDQTIKGKPKSVVTEHASPLLTRAAGRSPTITICSTSPSG